MTLTELNKLNRLVCEWLGICWHEPKLRRGYPNFTGLCKKCGNSYVPNPDFAADPVALLREMMKREDWTRFKCYLTDMCDLSQDECDDFDWVFGLLSDTTGKILRAVETFEPFVKWAAERGKG